MFLNLTHKLLSSGSYFEGVRLFTRAEPHTRYDLIFFQKSGTNAADFTANLAAYSEEGRLGIIAATLRGARAPFDSRLSVSLNQRYTTGLDFSLAETRFIYKDDSDSFDLTRAQFSRAAEFQRFIPKQVPPYVDPVSGMLKKG